MVDAVMENPVACWLPLVNIEELEATSIELPSTEEQVKQLWNAVLALHNRMAVLETRVSK
jgi:hypothetical protein